ncbi:MAG: hypothetical protein HYX60_05170, partial [Legionella longbeachae]|nr:hypothetical protein [Legionella longbeachae]
MYNSKFFEKYKNNIETFNTKLSKAIGIIEQNQSVLAKQILKVISSKKLIISSFFNITQEYFLRMRKDIEEEKGEILSIDFPPHISTIRKLESHVDGIIYDNKIIYIDSKKKPQAIANILVHEICHFLNVNIHNQEKLNNGKDIANYCDEVRARTGEKIFEKNGHCLTRSNIKEIHKNVTDLYPEFLVDYEYASKLGYI